MEDWLSDLAARLVADKDDLALIQRRISAIDVEGAGALLEACRLIGEAAEPADLVSALASLPDALVATSLAALVMHAFAAVRVDYPSRQDAAAARVALSDRAEGVYPAIGDTFGADALSWIVRVVGQAVREVSDIAATRAPLVRVETGTSLPSSLLAFDLYGDPERGSEIVARNRVATPFVMPIAFEALAE